MGHLILISMNRGIAFSWVLLAKVHETIPCNHTKKGFRYLNWGSCSLKKSAVAYTNFAESGLIYSKEHF